MSPVVFTRLVILLLGAIATCAESQEKKAAIDEFLVNSWELSPSRFLLDFDGDGISDRVRVGGLIGLASDLRKVETLVHPWHYRGKVSDDLTQGSKSSFHIVLSASGDSYVIHDANPISILDTGAAQSLFAVPANRLAELEIQAIEAKAQGDLLGIPTEAGIDTYLYWNGKTFESHEPLELP